MTFAAGDPRKVAVMFTRFQTYPGEARVQTVAEPVAVEPVVAAPASQPQTPTIQRVDYSEGNLITTAAPQSPRLNGLAAVENGSYRWALGPETAVEFNSDRAQAVEVELSFINPIEDQSVTILFNGAVVQDLTRLDQGSEMSLKFRVNTIPGSNHLAFRFGDWNGNTVTFAPGDSRPMAVLFNTLDLHSAF